MLVCSAVVACENDNDNAVDAQAVGSDSSQTVEPRGACNASDRIGGFSVGQQENKKESYATGEVKNGVLPSHVPIEVADLGQCRLNQQNNPYCDPTCSLGTICDNSGACIDEPLNQDVGDVHIEGLNKSVIMRPDGNLGYWDSSLPHPAFNSNARIKLAALGNDLEGFVMVGKGVAALEADNTDWIITENQPLVINWTADTKNNATIYATLNVDQHGISPATIVCEAPDTGELVVPLELVDQLFGLGTSGAPTATLERHFVDSVQTALGCVEFKVFSKLAVTLSILE
ncbi:MAG: hypothetical protein JXA30_06180 [Deltaproteobacteria bacterium]|nr:hypothetical protein [Deltaproteobacteria bacterium]